MGQRKVQFIEWEKIPPSTACLTDASSLRELAEQASTLSAPLNPGIAQVILNDLDGFALLPALSLLERWLVVDTVVADLLAVGSSHPHRLIIDSLRPKRYRRSFEDTLTSAGNPQASLAHDLRRIMLEDSGTSADPWLAGVRHMAADLSIAFTSIPPAVFSRCVDLIGRTSKALRAAQPAIPWDSYGFGAQKAYGEALDEFYGGAAGLAGSHLGVERTLVYYEAGAAARVPVVLHPARFKEVEAIDRAASDAYSAVREILQRTFEDPVRQQLATLGLQSRIQWPPLVAKLVVEAGRQKASIIDIAREMKASPAAAAFRTWLSTIQEALGEGTTGGEVEALRMLRELQAVATKWSEELDVGLGVRYQRRQLRLSWIPRIGALLELLETSKVKDPILNRKGYLTFMSSWFER